MSDESYDGITVSLKSISLEILKNICFVSDIENREELQMLDEYISKLE